MSEKWWDMSDDELDDLFREASDKVDVPFDSSAYNKFRQKIAERPMSEPSRGFKKRWLFILAGLFLMVGVGLVYRFGSDLKENTLTKNVTNNGKKNKVKPLKSPLSASSSPLPVSSSPLSVSPQTTGKTHTTTKSSLKSPEINSQKVTDNAKLKKLSVGKQTTEEVINNAKLKKSSVRTQTTAKTELGQSSVKTQTTAKRTQTTAEKSSMGTQTRAEAHVPLSVPSQTSGKSSLPLSVSSQTTEKSFGENLAKLSERKQTTRGTATKETQSITKSSVGTQTTATGTATKETQLITKSSVGTQTTANETYNLSKSESDLLNNSEKVIENKQVRFGLNNPKTYAIERNKVIENIDFESLNKRNKLIRFNNSKNNKDREGKSYSATLQIIGQNTLPVSENSSNIQEQIVPEETINRTNFYDVDFLKNKGSKLLLTNIRAELPEYVDSLPRTIKPVRFSTFGIRLMLSPDFNSIDNLSKMALGGSVGLLFEYKISKKLVVQTGIVYSSKSYVGSFDDYRNWKDWKGYHPSKPTQVDGGCKVFDIPINVRLNLFQKPKQTWFVSSGVSSYWMMNENYTYNYAWGSPRAVGWNDNSKYYFSVLNFSVGLERQISKRFSLQVEPYLKTPLKNVGRGGVNLYSSGVLFSTKYCF